jgi:hypothetical protein
MPSVFPSGATDEGAGILGKVGRDQCKRLTLYVTEKQQRGQEQKMCAAFQTYDIQKRNLSPWDNLVLGGSRDRKGARLRGCKKISRQQGYWIKRTCVETLGI